MLYDVFSISHIVSSKSDKSIDFNMWSRKSSRFSDGIAATEFLHSSRKLQNLLPKIWVNHIVNVPSKSLELQKLNLLPKNWVNHIVNGLSKSLEVQKLNLLPKNWVNYIVNGPLKSLKVQKLNLLPKHWVNYIHSQNH